MAQKAMINKELCMSCGQCIDNCSNNAISIDLNDLSAYKGFVVNQNKCIACGDCLDCPGDAIKIK